MKYIKVSTEEYNEQEEWDAYISNQSNKKMPKRTLKQLEYEVRLLDAIQWETLNNPDKRIVNAWYDASEYLIQEDLKK